MRKFFATSGAAMIVARVSCLGQYSANTLGSVVVQDVAVAGMVFGSSYKVQKINAFIVGSEFNVHVISDAVLTVLGVNYMVKVITDIICSSANIFVISRSVVIESRALWSTCARRAGTCAARTPSMQPWCGLFETASLGCRMRSTLRARRTIEGGDCGDDGVGGDGWRVCCGTVGGGSVDEVGVETVIELSNSNLFTWIWSAWRFTTVSRCAFQSIGQHQDCGLGTLSNE